MRYSRRPSLRPTHDVKSACQIHDVVTAVRICSEVARLSLRAVTRSVRTTRIRSEGALSTHDVKSACQIHDVVTAVRICSEVARLSLRAVTRSVRTTRIRSEGALLLGINGIQIKTWRRGRADAVESETVVSCPMITSRRASRAGWSPNPHPRATRRCTTYNHDVHAARCHGGSRQRCWTR